ncbi:MAG: hypothetical protein OEY22_05350 [Candidatus Bathyarchaeota archaeon]|nr:hypothetical protein [Candidatus Bathyarchaeota archaeon]MDH5788500.1 hypothetical protein [Candidatus Bathyarchaeota archaeon]
MAKYLLNMDYVFEFGENEEAYDQSLEYYVISVYHDCLQHFKIKLKEIAQRGENIVQILNDMEKRLSKDYETILKQRRPSLVKELKKSLKIRSKRKGE